jgi:rhodanese-related sulfurtransferase
MPVSEIEPRELQDLLARREVTLIDVREPWEAEICSIEGGTLVPMGSLPQRLQEIPADKPVALYCHHGVRSLMVAGFMAKQGYDARSLAGGIAAWAEEIEPKMARY